MLVVIDNFNRFGWAVPFKNKNAQPKTDAFAKCIGINKPKFIETHDGKEFLNKISSNFLNTHSIKKIYR